MSKIISFNREAKEKLKAGIDKVNNAVSVTMGPFGRNVLIEKDHGQVASTKDGVTVAKTVTLALPSKVVPLINLPVCKEEAVLEFP